MLRKVISAKFIEYYEIFKTMKTHYCYRISLYYKLYYFQVRLFINTILYYYEITEKLNT